MHGKSYYIDDDVLYLTSYLKSQICASHATLIVGALCEFKTSVPLPWHLDKSAGMKSAIFLFAQV